MTQISIFILFILFTYSYFQYIASQAILFYLSINKKNILINSMNHLELRKMNLKVNTIEYL